MLKIGNEYEVIVGEGYDGSISKQKLKLVKIEKYNEIEVYIFSNEVQEYFVSYQNIDENNVDWDFISLLCEIYL